MLIWIRIRIHCIALEIYHSFNSFLYLVAESLGTGIVRRIDPAARILYVATTADPARLTSVNCLLAGATLLPESVLLEAAGGGKRISARSDPSAAVQLPYVNFDRVAPMDLPWQRNHQYGKF